jgi:hypothetical protein
MAEQTLERRNGDVFIETPREEYGMVNAKVTNDTGAAVDLTKEDLIGYPVYLDGSTWKLCIPATDEAACDGLIFNPREGLDLADTVESEHEFAILVRGPAVVNLDEIETGFVVATLATALAAKSPPIIRFINESVTEDTDA